MPHFADDDSTMLRMNTPRTSANALATAAHARVDACRVEPPCQLAISISQVASSKESRSSGARSGSKREAIRRGECNPKHVGTTEHVKPRKWKTYVIITTTIGKSEESPEPKDEKPSKEPRAWANEERPPCG